MMIGALTPDRLLAMMGGVTAFDVQDNSATMAASMAGMIVGAIILWAFIRNRRN